MRPLFRHSGSTVTPGDKAGLAPGTPVFVGERKIEKARIDIIHYTAENVQRFDQAGVDDCVRLAETHGVTWINVTGMHDTLLSSAGNRMNEIMKVLTIIATIFIPLTFIAGIYGMNFRNMPELEWRWGYFVALGVMAVSAVSMLLFFKVRRWL